MKICNKCTWLGKQKKTHSYICLNSDSKLYKVPFPHSKTRKACSLYKSLDVSFSVSDKARDHPLIPQIIEPHDRPLFPRNMPKAMRWIEDLHNIHKGEEIWVLGCGPSLDDFPDHFFDEKYRIAITSTWSMLAFPNCTYAAFSQIDKAKLKHVMENRRHLLHKHIVRLRPTELKIGVFIGPEPIYSRISENLGLLRSKKSFEKEYLSSLAKNLLSGISMFYASSATCIHWEIQAAIVMGAKKVTLAGCEVKLRKFQGHASKRGMDRIYGYLDKRVSENGYPDSLVRGENGCQKRQKGGTAFLAKIMKPHGIQIARYYYNKGYELVEDIK